MSVPFFCSYSFSLYKSNNSYCYNTVLIFTYSLRVKFFNITFGNKILLHDILTIDNNGQPISDKCITETIIGKRVLTKSFDSINEYVRRVILINAVLSIDVMTSFCKLEFIQTRLLIDIANKDVGCQKLPFCLNSTNTAINKMY